MIKEKINLEELVIYKQYLELMNYTYMIIKKYPKVERHSLVAKIINTTTEGMHCIIAAHKEYQKEQKMRYLNMLDTNLKFLKVLIRLSYKEKYISSNNYGAWSKKLKNIGNLLGGWINSCRKR